MFSGLTKKFQGIFSKISSEKVFTEENMKDAVREVRLALLDADVNYKVASDFVKRIKEKVIGSDFLIKSKKSEEFIDIVHKELIDLMGENEEVLNFSKAPTKVLLCGLQGSGKTTTSVKLAQYIQQQENKKCNLVALDLQRPAAIKQLELLAEQINVPVISVEGERDPEVVARKAIESTCDVMIFDTAGRQNLDDELMEELSNLKKVINPDYIIFVANCGSGQQAVNVAKAFDEKIGLSGSILTMLDGSARAGAAISIKEITGKPLFFEGVGEKISDFQVFNPKSMADRILGMGDVINLMKNLKKEISDSESKELEKKIRKATFTYEDFLKQMKIIKNMGSFKGIMKMMPGMGGDMPDPSDAEFELKLFEAIIHSMTKKERMGLDELTMGRKKRIARGCGLSLGNVNRLVKKFKQMKQMAKQMPKFQNKNFMENMKKNNLMKKNPYLDRFFS